MDYDNLLPGLSSSTVDAVLQAQQLIRTLVGAFQSLFSDVQELDVRLYGGWTDERGTPSRAAVGLLPILPELRGRRRGVIVRPSLAFSMMEFPDLVLRGTVRERSRRKRQKMVDGMLGCDAVFASSKGQSTVGVVTDDDDLLPALLASHAASATPAILLRRRPMGAGMNDVALTDRGIRIHCIDEG